MFSPLYYRLKSRIIGGAGSSDFTYVDTICFSEKQECQPAICLDGDKEKITGVAPFMADIKDALNILDRREVVHGETKIYKVNDAIMYRGGLYANGKRMVLCKELKSRMFGKVDCEIDEAALPWIYNASVYFGSWCREIPVRNALATELSMSVVPYSKRYLHQGGYEKLLDIKSNSYDSVKISTLSLPAMESEAKAGNPR